MHRCQVEMDSEGEPEVEGEASGEKEAEGWDEGDSERSGDKDGSSEAGINCNELVTFLSWQSWLPQIDFQIRKLIL